jgi:O-antigen/teichoic acid export membrane protein
VLQLVLLGCLLGAAAVTAAALLGRGVLSVLFRPEYGQHVNVFVRLMIVAAITYVGSGQGYIMTAARSLKPQIAVHLCGGLASVVACALLIPARGIEGAADAAIVAALVQLAGASLILLRIDRRFVRESQPAYVPGAAQVRVQ